MSLSGFEGRLTFPSVVNLLVDEHTLTVSASQLQSWTEVLPSHLDSVCFHAVPTGQ